MNLVAAYRSRFLDVLASIYIYNEHRGDEHKHYRMFRRWFELQGKMPLVVDRTCGHIDRFVEIVFRRTIDELDTDKIIAEDDEFEKLCRVI